MRTKALEPHLLTNMADTSLLTSVALDEICSRFGEIVSPVIFTLQSPSFPAIGFEFYRIEEYVHDVELGSASVLNTARAL